MPKYLSDQHNTVTFVQVLNKNIIGQQKHTLKTLQGAVDILAHIGFIVMMAAMPLSKGAASVAMICLLVFAFYRFLLEPKSLFKRIKQQPVLVGMFLLYFVYLLGMLHTQNIAYGQKMLYQQTPLIVLAFIALHYQEMLRCKGKTYFWAFIGGTLVNAGITLIFFLLSDELARQISDSAGIFRDFPDNKSRIQFGLYSPLIDRIQFSNMVAIAALSSAYLFFRGPHRKLAFLSVILLIATSLFLGGRGGQIGLFAGLMVMAAAYAIKRVQPIIAARSSQLLANISIAALLLAFAIGLPRATYQFVPSVKLRYDQMFWELKQLQRHADDQPNMEHFTSVRRLVSWQNYWSLTSNNWLTGVGTGDVIDEVRKIYDTDPYKLPLNNHSQYLFLWAVAGIIGLLILVAIALYWLWYLYRHRPLTLFIFGLASMGFYAAVFLLDAVLLRQIDIMGFAILFCFIPCLEATTDENFTVKTDGH